MITTEEYLNSIGLDVDTAIQNWVEPEFEWECPECRRVNNKSGSRWCECGKAAYSKKYGFAYRLNLDAGSSGYIDPIEVMEKEGEP